MVAENSSESCISVVHEQGKRISVFNGEYAQSRLDTINFEIGAQYNFVQAGEIKSTFTVLGITDDFGIHEDIRNSPEEISTYIEKMKNNPGDTTVVVKFEPDGNIWPFNYIERIVTENFKKAKDAEVITEKGIESCISVVHEQGKRISVFNGEYAQSRLDTINFEIGAQYNFVQAGEIKSTFTVLGITDDFGIDGDISSYLDEISTYIEKMKNNPDDTTVVVKFEPDGNIWPFNYIERIVTENFKKAEST